MFAWHSSYTFDEMNFTWRQEFGNGRFTAEEIVVCWVQWCTHVA